MNVLIKVLFRDKNKTLDFKKLFEQTAEIFLRESIQ